MECINASVVCALLVATTAATGKAATNTVNLSRFPDTGWPVPSGTVLSNQWQSIGILFSARVDTTPIGLAAYGSPPSYILSSPDVYGAVAIFTFVDTNSLEAAHADYFSLIVDMQGNEAAELACLDDLGNVVTQTNYTRTTGGFDFVPITLAVSGEFAKVELRTQGNPGIGARDIKFQTLTTNAVGAPMLTIVPAAVGKATISWSPNTPGFVLQETLRLSPTNWINSASGTNNPVTVPVPGDARFYRLFKP